jgi:ribosomal protein L22
MKKRLILGLMIGLAAGSSLNLKASATNSVSPGFNPAAQTPGVPAPAIPAPVIAAPVSVPTDRLSGEWLTGISNDKIGAMGQAVMSQANSWIQSTYRQASSAVSNAVNPIFTSIGGALGGVMGGASNVAQEQQQAQQQAQQQTIGISERAMRDVAGAMRGVSTANAMSTAETSIDKSQGKTGGIQETATYTNAAQAMASDILSKNPATGGIIDRAGVSNKASSAIAYSANGANGQVDLNTRLSQTSKVTANMQTIAEQAPDSSLEQLNLMSQQLAQIGVVGNEGVKLAAENRTLQAALLAQSTSNAEVELDQKRMEEKASKTLRQNAKYNYGLLARIGSVTPVVTPATPPTPILP